MSRVVVDDPSVIAAFDAVHDRTEVFDASGRVLGLFVPYSTQPKVFYRGVKSPLSAEERERLIREEGPTARPLSEFWDDMKKKYPDEFP